MNNENHSERQKKRAEQAIEAAKNPANYLGRIKSIPGINPLMALIELRQIIKTTSDIVIEAPDETFVKFYRADNASPLFFESICTMMQMAGYTRDEVGNMVVDFLRKEDGVGKEVVIEKLTTLSNNAIESVYGEKGTRLQ